jgi:XTP/dITP diphosphohydrolase
MCTSQAEFRALVTHDAPVTLVIGTRNRKKGAELAELLEPHGFHVVTLDDFPNAIEVVEDGDSFAANAALKATRQARHLARWVLADDSGLEVDALAGAPGIFSARFAGPNATDEMNNAELLSRLGDLPLEQRTARYVCHVTVAEPSGRIRAESHDVCHGRIRFEPAGSNGFGYDPLFEVVEYHRTFGELGPHVKRAISHRSRALRAIVPKLLEILDAGCSMPDAG